MELEAGSNHSFIDNALELDSLIPQTKNLAQKFSKIVFNILEMIPIQFTKIQFLETFSNLQQKNAPRQYIHNKATIKWEKIYCSSIQFALNQSKINFNQYSKHKFCLNLVSAIVQFFIQKQRNLIQIEKMSIIKKKLKKRKHAILKVIDFYPMNLVQCHQESWVFTIESRQPKKYIYYFTNLENNVSDDEKINRINVSYDTPWITIVQEDILTKEKKKINTDPYCLISKNFAEQIMHAEKDDKIMNPMNEKKYNKKVKSKKILNGFSIIYPDVKSIEELISFYRTLLKKIALISSWINNEKLKKHILEEYEDNFYNFFLLACPSGFEKYCHLKQYIEMDIKSLSLKELNTCHKLDYESAVLMISKPLKQLNANKQRIINTCLNHNLQQQHATTSENGSQKSFNFNFFSSLLYIWLYKY